MTEPPFPDPTAAGDPHPSGEELSAFVDGELDVTRAGEVREHLAICGRCDQEQADLAEIRAELSSLADLGGSFDSEAADITALQLARAEAKQSAVTTALAAVEAATVTAINSKRRGPPKALVGVAAAAILVLGALGVVRFALHYGTGPSSSAANTLKSVSHGGPASAGAPYSIAFSGAGGPTRTSEWIDLHASDVSNVKIVPTSSAPANWTYSAVITLKPTSLALHEVMKGPVNTFVVFDRSGSLVGAAARQPGNVIVVNGLTQAQAVDLKESLTRR
jgi:hypothetical protein